MKPRPLLAALTSLALAGSAALLTTVPAAAEPSPGGQGPGGVNGGGGLPVDKIAPSLAAASGQVTALVQLDSPSGLDVLDGGGDVADVQAATAEVEQMAAAVVPDQATSRGATPAPQRVATVGNLLAATIVTGDAASIRELAGSDDVLAIYRVVLKTPDNSSTDPFTRALDVWQSAGQTGEGVRIGVIDTGIDYTHAAFGGPGTLEAYAEAYGADGTGAIRTDLLDPTKILGGHDFAGPLYDGNPQSTLPGTVPFPTPDANPIDSPHTSGNSGHGTHVAGTAAGFGVLGDGTTFRGDYADLTDLSDWKVGPGAAPGAALYALKIFGDLGGSTGLTSLALDWAADPDGDGDFNDHLDVLNLSLGSSGAPADDPDNLLIDRLADLGTLSVISAGNSGDITDIAGSPGTARSALTVANSVASPVRFDGVQITAATDQAVVGSYSAQNSISYAGTDDVTAPVAFLGDRVDGCASLTGRAAEITGKIVYLWWDDNDASRRCGSGARFNLAQAAGAVGVLLGTTSTVFAAGIAGNAGIPGAQLTATSTVALLPAIRTGGLTAHIGPSLAASVLDDSVGDVLNPGSSRGTHGSLGTVKPDVSAPGTTIYSASSGTGADAQSLSGTSMAAPHVAGISALVRAAKPGWTPTEVKADVMNTATHDVFTGAHQTGTAFGPLRVGSGRVDALDAVTNTTLAYASADQAGVSVTFGVVPVAATTVVQSKTVTVKNTGPTAVEYATSFVAATTAGGATITTKPTSLTVPAGTSRTVTVTLTADPATLERTPDPTSATLQAGIPREYVANLSGRLLLKADDAELRVPVHAAPRLVSTLTADPVSFADAGAATAELALSGRGVDSGGWTSLAAPLQLAVTSPQLERTPGLATSASTLAAGDLRAVGWSSTAPQHAAAGSDPADGYLAVGVATQAEWASLGQSLQPVIDIDVDGDGAYDLQTVVQKYAASADVTVQATYDYTTGAVLDIQPVNGFFGDVDTTVFDNNVVVVPISLAAVGITPGTTPLLDVWTYSPYAASGSGEVDRAPSFTVDPFSPPLWFDTGDLDGIWALGADDTSVTVHRTAGVAAPQLLVLHSHNATPTSRWQVAGVTVPPAVPTATTLAVTGGSTAGSERTLTATVTAPSGTVAGTVRFLDGQTEIASAAVDAGVARATVKLGGGTHALSAVFTPATAALTASTSPVVTVDVKRSGSSLTFTLSKDQVSYGSPAVATVVVTGRTAAPSGTVEIREGSKVVASGELVVSGLTGTAKVALPADLAVGSHRLTASYAASPDVEASSAQRTYRVTPARATVTLATDSWSVPRGTAPVVKVSVAGAAGASVPTGRVTIVVDLRPVATVALKPDGTATVTLPKLTRSSLVTVLYSGAGGYAPAATAATIRVR